MQREIERQGGGKWEKWVKERRRLRVLIVRRFFVVLIFDEQGGWTRMAGCSFLKVQGCRSDYFLHLGWLVRSRQADNWQRKLLPSDTCPAPCIGCRWLVVTGAVVVENFLPLDTYPGGMDGRARRSNEREKKRTVGREEKKRAHTQTQRTKHRAQNKQNAKQRYIRKGDTYATPTVKARLGTLVISLSKKRALATMVS